MPRFVEGIDLQIRSRRLNNRVPSFFLRRNLKVDELRQLDVEVLFCNKPLADKVPPHAVVEHPIRKRNDVPARRRSAQRNRRKTFDVPRSQFLAGLESQITSVSSADDQQGDDRGQHAEPNNQSLPPNASPVHDIPRSTSRVSTPAADTAASMDAIARKSLEGSTETATGFQTVC